MLNLHSVGELAWRLGTNPRRLFYIADHADDYVRHYELHNPASPDRKARFVTSPTGPLRRVQVQLLRGIFRERLHPTPYSFGGVPGRNAVQNASVHLGSRFVYTTDISNFFPSIPAGRLREIFEIRLGCSNDVAWLLTRLCTHDGHLAQGLITSPILADHAVRRVDHRISGLCRQRGLSYSRFVDDVTVSGPFPLDLNTSGIVELVRRILGDCGFDVAIHKEQAGRLGQSDIAITGLRIIRGHLDVKEHYVRSLEEQLEQHRLLGLGEGFSGPLFTRDQLTGRVEYVCSINQNRRRLLRQRLGLINWGAVSANAEVRGLAICRRQLLPAALEVCA